MAPRIFRIVTSWTNIETYQRPDGIGYVLFEKLNQAKAVLHNLSELYEVFKDYRCAMRITEQLKSCASSI